MEDLHFVLLLVIIFICSVVLVVIYFFVKRSKSKHYPFDGSHPVDEDDMLNDIPVDGSHPPPPYSPRPTIFWLDDPPPPYPGRNNNVVILVLDKSALKEAEANNLFVNHI